MFNWFWKWLGYHVCEEFTQWENHTHIMKRAATLTERSQAGWREVSYLESWQQRACTLCGKIQQREVKYPFPVNQSQPKHESTD